MNASTRQKTGLVLEGGATRGIYTAGVLDVLGERRVAFDGVIGVSAGAIHGISFLANQVGRSIRYYLAFCRNPRFFGFKNLLLTGNFVGNTFCYKDIPERLAPFDNDAFEASSSEFFITCSDVETGEAYHRRTQSVRGEDMDILRATASLPVLSQIVEVDGRKLLDGGIADSIPIRALRQMGFPKCLVVLTQIDGYRKKPSRSPLPSLLYRRYPAFVQAIAQRHNRYNATLDHIAELEASGQIHVLRPSRKVNISRLERHPERILEMYELGRKDALEHLDQILAFLSDTEKPGV